MSANSSRHAWRGIATSTFLALLICAAGIATPRSARADVDLNGNFVAGSVIVGFQILCSIDITQTGTALSATGTCDFIGAISLSGTIDPMTGVFSASGNAAAICSAPGSLTIAATATPDSSSFSGTVDCSGFMGNLFGSRCGNSQLDPGEVCDQGFTANGAFGSCCSATCQYASSAVMCRNPFNCDPAEFCTGTSETCPADVHDPDGTACGPTNPCVTGETCTGGICGGGTPLPSGTTCEDPFECVNFECDGFGSCEPVFTSDPCDDFDACTANDTCTDGFCQGGPSVDCGACSACDSVEGCYASVAATCKQPTAPGSPLTLGSGSSPSANRVVWRWLKGEQTAVTDFGDPRTTIDYTLCVYDHDDSAFDGVRLMLSANAPAGSNWSPNSRGYRYKDTSGTPNGLRRVLLKEGSDGKAHITVSGNGAGLSLASLPAQVPVTVQLKASNGMCWGAAYGTAGTNNPIKLKAKSGP